MFNHTGGCNPWRLPDCLKHLAIQIQQRLSFFGTLVEVDPKKRYTFHSKTGVGSKKLSGAYSKKQSKRREQER